MTIKSKVAAIIVCGGSGSRMNSDIPKQYLKIGDQMIVEVTIAKFRQHNAVDKIILVIAKDAEHYLGDVDLTGVDVVYGGDTRQKSVSNAINILDAEEYSHVLIHDGVRPFVSEGLISNVISELDSGSKGVIPGLHITDTLKRKREDGSNKVQETVDRESVIAVQTPQGFSLGDLQGLYEKYQYCEFTDDALLFEEAGMDVKIIEGCRKNYKITRIGDLEKARRDNEKYNNGNGSDMSSVRIGQGYDVHAFEDGDRIILCGVEIPHSKKLKGHSDADVAWHAVTDAILGAAGNGDIGEHFSDKDPRWQGADSKQFLVHASELAKDKGFTIGNVDLTIICEEPKLSSFKEKMKVNTALALGIEADMVNVKATTSEKLGFLGRSEGIATQAVVLLVKKSS